MADNKTQNNQGKEQNVSDLIKVRYDKLADLQENGKDPFSITKYDVTHHSLEIKDNYDELENKEVTISRLSYGLPIGAEIDYLDVLTLDKALEDRKKIA